MPAQIEALTEKERKEILHDLNDLLQLDHDAIGAYEVTIERLENQEWAETVGLFKGDHERHARDIASLIRRLGGDPKQKPHVTGALKNALIAAGAMAGDKGVLVSFRGNELQVRAKYDKYAAKQTYPAEVAELIRRNAQDEHRHYAWVKAVVGAE